MNQNTDKLRTYPKLNSGIEMKYQISVPSKTFLLGEYIALIGGPALILTSNPRFSMVATLKNDLPKIVGVNPDSPAGKLIQIDSNFYQNYQIEFNDPYHQLGGFGASSAQYLMLIALRNYVQKKAWNEEDLLAEYQKIASDMGQTFAPSGADLIAQLHGRICFFYKNNNLIQSFDWPFADLEYGLIHTSKKTLTHIHLQNLTHFEHSAMEKIALQGLKSIKERDSKTFLQMVQCYADEMQKQNLIAQHTQVMLKELLSFPKILAAKGCGSFGADVILICFYKKDMKNVINFVKEKNFNLVTHGSTVNKGLNIEMIYN